MSKRFAEVREAHKLGRSPAELREIAEIARMNAKARENLDGAHGPEPSPQQKQQRELLDCQHLAQRVGVEGRWLGQTSPGSCFPEPNAASRRRGALTTPAVSSISNAKILKPVLSVIWLASSRNRTSRNKPNCSRQPYAAGERLPPSKEPTRRRIPKRVAIVRSVPSGSPGKGNAPKGISQKRTDASRQCPRRWKSLAIGGDQTRQRPAIHPVDRGRGAPASANRSPIPKNERLSAAKTTRPGCFVRFGILWRKQMILPSKSSGRHPAPDMDAITPRGALSSLFPEGPRFVFLPSCRRSRLRRKIARRGGHGLLSLSVPLACTTRPLSLPAPTAWRGALPDMFSFLNFKEKSAVSKFFCLRTSRAIARKGSAPLRRCCCSLKHKNPDPPNFFPCSAPPCLAVRGGQRGRDWRSLTNRKGKRP